MSEEKQIKEESIKEEAQTRGWFDDATCTLYGHNYKNGKCTRCGKKKP